MVVSFVTLARPSGKIYILLHKDNRNRLLAYVPHTNRLLHANALHTELPGSTLAPLQRVLHAAARFVAHLRPRDHVTAALMALHWLPVRQRITYKLQGGPN